MAESAAAMLSEGRARFRGRLRFRSLLGNAQERKACRAALDNDAVFEGAMEYASGLAKEHYGGEWLKNLWKLIQEYWALILKYILSLLALV